MEDGLRLRLEVVAGRGGFGPGRLASVVTDCGADLGIQLASRVSLLRLDFREPERSLRVVVKRQLAEAFSRDSRDTPTMFYNEIVMYKYVLPFLDVRNERCYPLMYHGEASRGADLEKDIVILENVKSRGYEIAKDRVFLDYDHIVLAMKRIGQLHSWSYVSKQRDPNGFQTVRNKLRKQKMTVDEKFDIEKGNFLSMKRGIDPFLKENKEVSLLNKYLSIVRPVLKVTEFLFEGEEPFAAIIHGDYCNNNVFYKYDESNKPVDLAYFDLQLAKYGCPVVDLSFFLYMHTTKDMRHQHWDELLDIYWKSVREHTPNDVTLPSYEEFLEYFSKRAVYGYFPCSFFLPAMLDVAVLDFEKFCKMSEEEKLAGFLSAGGEEGLNRICDIVSHLLEKQYIHKFVEYYGKKCKHK